MRLLLLTLVLAFLTAPAVFSQTEGSRRFVAVESAEVRDSTGFFARGVGTLSLGDEVAALRESGRWTEVRAEGISGWVASAGLSARRVLPSGAAVTVGEVALAGKGFSQEMETQLRQEGLDFSLVDAMERAVVPRDELMRFIEEGRLARGD